MMTTNPTADPSAPKAKSRRGFASMSPEKRTEIARKGGSNVPSDKRSFSTRPGLAAQAGAKGGKAPRNMAGSTGTIAPIQATA
jgi:general stress protein YciG